MGLPSHHQVTPPDFVCRTGFSWTLMSPSRVKITLFLCPRKSGGGGSSSDEYPPISWELYSRSSEPDIRSQKGGLLLFNFIFDRGCFRGRDTHTREYYVEFKRIWNGLANNSWYFSGDMGLVRIFSRSTRAIFLMLPTFFLVSSVRRLPFSTS